MYRAFLAAFGSMLFMTACVPSAAPSLRVEPSQSWDACSAITTATSVQVLLPPGTAPVGKGAYRLTDPETVRRLVDFVNLRKNVSPPSADTPPTPKLRATFYDGTRTVGIFGSGPGVFYLQCGTVRGTRYASAAETTEFEMLSARPSAAP
jgi:hypothetical protein